MKFTVYTACFIALILSSCGHETYYALGDYSAVKKIDTHTHPNTTNTALVELAKEDNFIMIDRIFYKNAIKWFRIKNSNGL